MAFSMKALFVAALAVSTGSNALGTAPLVTGTGSSNPHSSTGIYNYPNGTATNSLAGTGTGVSGPPVPTVFTGLFKGALPAGAEQLLSEVAALDRAVNLAEDEAQKALSALEGFFGFGGNSASSTAAPSTGTPESLARRKLKKKPSPPPQSKPKPPPATKSAPPVTKSTPTKSATPTSKTTSTTTKQSSSSSVTTPTSHSTSQSTSQSTSHSTSHSTSQSTSHSTSHKSSSSHSSSTHSSSTSSAVLTKASPFTPPCGPKSCTGDKTGTCVAGDDSLELSGLKRRLTPRAAAGSSLQARALNRRYPASPPLADYAEKVVKGTTEEDVLNINTVRLWPELKNNVGLEESTSQILTYASLLHDLSQPSTEEKPVEGLQKGSFNIGTGHLSGCTGVYIVSETAVFFAHYWQTRAFEYPARGRPIDFQGQVIKPLYSGSEVDEQPVHQSLQANAHLFGADTKVFIMTPCLDVRHRETRRYDKQVDDLRTGIQTILGHGVQFKEYLYRQADSGWYTPGEVSDLPKTLEGGKARQRKHPKVGSKSWVYMYPEMKYTHTGSAGWGVFQYTQTAANSASVRVIFESEKQYEHQFDPQNAGLMTPA